jgi:hypothetical protein
MLKNNAIRYSYAFFYKNYYFIQVKENDARRKSKRAARNPATAADTGVDIKVMLQVPIQTILCL